MTSFADLGLSAPVLEALQSIGYEQPSPIQEQAIPILLNGSDMIGQAQTGSGKTAAFGLPLIEHVDADDRSLQALVLTPTRELCIQVTQALRTYGAPKGVDVVAVFGGAPIRGQQAQLHDGGHVVVGTVGRVKDLISRGSLQLSECRYVVLDEADEMLDLGFLEDVEAILKLCPNGRQTALFSATMAPEIRALADHYLYYPELVKVKAATLTVDSVEQFRLEVGQKDKAEKLVEVLREERPDQAIVFTRTKIRADQLYKRLDRGGMNVKALHGDLSQGQLDGVMLSFKAGRVPILVAIDVAARGLDISTVTHVVNFDVPNSPDTYVHRIGRTGRIGRSGRAVTFVEPKQVKELAAIEDHIGTKLTPWKPGEKAAPAKVEEKPKRHAKPQITRSSDEPSKRCVAAIGSADGVEVADLIGAITGATGLEGEAIRDVRVLDRVSLFSLPESELDQALASLKDAKVGGQALSAEPLR